MLFCNDFLHVKKINDDLTVPCKKKKIVPVMSCWLVLLFVQTLLVTLRIKGSDTIYRRNKKTLIINLMRLQGQPD